MNSRAIVLFTGDPKREALRKGVPARFLDTLHQHLKVTVQERRGVRLVVASEDAGQFTLTCGDHTRSEASLSLGGKITAAFQFAFALGCESVLLLAGDVAGIDAKLLEESFDTLDRDAKRCVIGPSRDGGFYLLGLNRSGALATSIHWDAITWFASSTASELGAQAVQHGAELELVRRVDDIDSLADAIRVTAELPSAFLLLRNRLRSLLVSRAPQFNRGHAPAATPPRHASLFRGPPAA